MQIMKKTMKDFTVQDFNGNFVKNIRETDLYHASKLFIGRLDKPLNADGHICKYSQTATVHYNNDTFTIIPA